MNPWVEGAERIGCTRTGGSYDGTPFCFVVHTVEGDPGTVAACRRLAETHAEPPQLWYSPRLDWFAQGIPLTRTGYALAHPKGTPETNRAGAIQVEVFGFARDTPNWPGEWLERIGRRVLGGVLTAGYPIDLSQIAPTTGNDGYGLNGAVRFSAAQWATFPGVCCHSNVAFNAHWDAGAIDLHRIVAAAGGTGLAPSPQPQEDDIVPLHLITGDKEPEGKWWVTDLVTKRHVWSPDEAARIVVRTRSQGGKIECTDQNGAVTYEQADVDSIPTVP